MPVYEETNWEYYYQKWKNGAKDNIDGIVPAAGPVHTVNATITKAQKLALKASSNKRTQTSYSFPEKLNTEGTQNIIRFMFNLPSGSKYLKNGYYRANTNGQTTSTYRASKDTTNIARRFSKNYVRTTTFIDLYMPPNIQTNYSSNWGTQNLDFLGEAIDAYGGGINYESSKKFFATEAKNYAERNAGEIVQGLTAFNGRGAYEAYSSTISNPYTEVLFNGVNNRTFSFTFKMTPRNAKERDIVQNIVKTFEFNSLPEFKFSEYSNFILFPSEIDIEFIRKDGSSNDYLFKISTCAITNVAVDYSTNGEFASHSDGSSVTTSLTIELMEMEQLTKQRALDGY